MKIFVGSLPWSAEDQNLRTLFEKFGQVDSASVLMDKFTGRSRGFGFVEMPDDESAKQAISALNGSDMEGRAIVVNEAKERTEGFGPDKRKGGGNYGNKGGGGYNRNRY